MDQHTIDQIVRASGVHAGEMVLVHLWGEDDALPAARMFMDAAAALGASPVLLQQSRTANLARFAHAADEAFDARYFSALSGFDAVLDLFAYQPIVLGQKPEEAVHRRYRRYVAELWRVLMQARRFTQIRLPTAANAAESALEPADFMARMERAYAIDYAALQSRCRALQAALSAREQLRLCTGEGCCLSFDLTGRAWHVDAGDGDWPCGEVYIAPVEQATGGTVFFPQLFIEDVGEFRDVTLVVSGGRVESASQPGVNAWLESLAPESRVVCELGFGANPGVTDACGYTVLDEKMDGSFHIALGANTMFGGLNEAPGHIDLVGGRYELSP